MIFDIHVHSRHYSGCSDIEADDLLMRAEAVGLNGLALTEHGIRWPEKKLRALCRKAGQRDLVLFAGQEITCFSEWKREGDFLVFGVEKSLGSNISASELIRIVHGEGGIVVPAHPFKRSRDRKTLYGIGNAMLNLDIDAIELYHPDHDGAALARVKEIAEKKGNLPLTGGSDAHQLDRVGACVTRFHDPVHTEQQFIEAIQSGRVTPQASFA
jgi:hypothetical protein